MTLKESLIHRHSYYALQSHASISDEEIEEILQTALSFVPSAFNSQSTRIVLLLGESHQKMWTIVKAVLKPMTTEAQYPKTEEKINSSFASAYGTVLFFEDEQVTAQLQDQFPSYKDHFSKWSEHTNAMHQLIVWMMLEETGMGASLQHYNPVIDKDIQSAFSLPENWRLIAQMPFGTLKDKNLPDKPKLSPESRMRVFK